MRAFSTFAPTRRNCYWSISANLFSGSPPDMLGSMSLYLGVIFERWQLGATIMRRSCVLRLLTANWSSLLGRSAVTSSVGSKGKAGGQRHRDLKREFPKMRTFSRRNLKYMRSFAEVWADEEFVQQVAAQLPWVHLLPATFGKSLVLFQSPPGSAMPADGRSWSRAFSIASTCIRRGYRASGALMGRHHFQRRGQLLEKYFRAVIC